MLALMEPPVTQHSADRFRPMPHDFAERYLELGLKGCARHYSAWNRTVRRWLEQLDRDALRAERMRRVMAQRSIRAARSRCAMTQAELAAALRMGTDGKRAVRRWESGDRQISGPAQIAILALMSGWRPVMEAKS